jgi:hypothetical protein
VDITKHLPSIYFWFSHGRKAMRAGMLGGVFFLLTICGCSHRTNDSPIDLAAAQRLGDAFMADLIAHRTDAALDKMEPEFQRMVNRSDFGPQVEKLFQYCGWPLDIELRDVGMGTKVYADGHTNPIRKFTYAANTNQYSRGICYFSVDVAPSGDTLKVTTFGPLRVTSGNPYPEPPKK